MESLVRDKSLPLYEVVYRYGKYTVKVYYQASKRQKAVTAYLKRKIRTVLYGWLGRGVTIVRIAAVEAGCELSFMCGWILGQSAFLLGYQKNCVFCGTYTNGYRNAYFVDVTDKVLHHRPFNPKAIGSKGVFLNGHALYGKYTLYHPEIGVQWSWLEQGRVLSETVRNLNLYDTAICNTDLTVRYLQLATDLDWQLVTNFAPSIEEQSSEMTEPNLLEWSVALKEEPKPCVLTYSIKRVDKSAKHHLFTVKEIV